MNENFRLDLAGKPTIFAAKKIILSCNMRTEDFLSIGDFVRVQDQDREFFVYLQSAQHYPLAEGMQEQGNTAITGRLIKQIDA